MRCMTRYILIEFVKVFLVALSGMTLLMVLGVVGQEFLRRGLSLVNVVKLLPFALPIAMRYAIPATTLFAACSIYGRISNDNEVVAVKSMGISPMVLVWPVLGLAFLLSLLVVGLTDLAVTWGRNGMNRVALESVEQIAYGMLRTQQSYSCKRFSIYVKRVDDRTLVQPTLTLRVGGNGDAYVVTARKAELSSNLAKNALRITLTDWEAEGPDGFFASWPGDKIFDIPLPDTANKPGASGSPSDVAMGQISPEVSQQKAKIAQLEHAYAAEAAYQLMTGGFHELSDAQWQERRISLQHAEERLHRLYTEPWRRWANGFSCLAFVVVGAPLAIRMRNSDVWTSFAVCFLPILGVYYPLLAFGVGQAKSGALPAYCVWSGNLVALAVGVVFMNRLLR